MTITVQDIPLRVDQHGVIRVGGTRLPLDTIVRAYEQGKTPEQIHHGFDAVSLADIFAAIGYYLAHKPQVRAYMQAREAEAEELRRECEQRWPPGGIKAQLTARRESREQP